MALLRKTTGILCAALAAALLLGGCSGEPEPVTSTDVVTIDGMYLDESFVDEEDEDLRRVYLLYTLHPEEENLEADSVYTELTINDTNTYESEHYPGACDWMGSYYYSSYIEDVTLGDELRVATVFEIPAADLEEGRTITLSDYQTPTIGEIELFTDDIVSCENPEAVAQEADPEGYEREQGLRAPVDAATADRVRNAINGWEWYAYVGSFSYRTQFSAGDRFVSIINGAQVEGSYQVMNGYILLTNDSNGYQIWVPYSWDEEGKINVDIASGYSVYE